MSHYSLVVFGSDVSDKLAPYSENDNDYFTDQNVTNEVLSSIAEHHAVDISQLSFDEILKKVQAWANYVVLTESELEEDGHPETSYVLVNDDNTKIIAIYDYFNHDAKWDWYSESGRWTNFFKVKNGVDENDYEVDIEGDNPNTVIKGYADSIRKKNIDFEGMREDFVKQYLPIYDLYQDLTNGMPEYKTFEMIKEENPNESNENLIDIHDGQQIVKMIHNLESNHPLKSYLNKKFIFSLEEFMMTREDFKKYKGISAYTPNSYIGLDGLFYSKEGLSEEEHKKQFQEYLDSIPDDTWMTIVDCHI